MGRRIIDLSYSIEEGMTTFPSLNHPRVEISILGRHGMDGRATRRLVLGTHTGTHVDAPLHFAVEGPSVDRLGLDTLVGPATVASLVPVKELQEITVDDLERVLGKTLAQPRVLLRFDWSSRWGNHLFYARSPFLSHDACKWLLDHGVRLIGMDTPSPDNPAHTWESGHDSPNHRLLLDNDVVLVEYLCNLDQIRSRTVLFAALPLKVVGGDGAPARVIAIEDDAVSQSWGEHADA